jgi:formylglycine-generating enzyme required for sulfatase activity
VRFVPLFFLATAAGIAASRFHARTAPPSSASEDKMDRTSSGRPQAAPRAWDDPDIGIRFVALPGGIFLMGSPTSEQGRGQDERLHEVKISAFSISTDEVTQKTWRRFSGKNPSHFARCGPDCPVESISWNEAVQFIASLNARFPGRNYRLPTEAQWEYACRAGTSTPFSTGDRLTTGQANFDGRYRRPGQPRGSNRGRPLPAGSFPSNPWGLRDMHGNVWEWCSDWYGPYPAGPVRDPAGPESGALKVIRGGSFYFDQNSCRCALRYTHSPADRGMSVGFRLAADPLRVAQSHGSHAVSVYRFSRSRRPAPRRRLSKAPAVPLPESLPAVPGVRRELR